MILLFQGVGLLLAALAVPLLKRKIPRNHFYGLRTADTLSDDAVWYEANARSARDLLRIGLGTCVGSALLYAVPWPSDEAYAGVCGLLLVAVVLVYAVRGFSIARRVAEERAGRPG